MTTLAAAARVGIDPQWLASLSVHSDDWTLWTSVAAEALDQQRQRDEAQADRIANGVVSRLAGMIPGAHIRRR